MGLYTTFYCVVGVHKKVSELIHVTKVVEMVPSCSHSDEARAGAFCAACGQPVTVKPREKKSQQEWDFEQYMMETANVIGVDWNHTSDEHSFLIGHYKGMSQDAPKNLREFQPNPHKGLQYVQAVLDKSPVPVIYKPTLDDITQYMYMDMS